MAALATHALIDEFSRIDTIKGQGARHVLTVPKVGRGVNELGAYALGLALNCEPPPLPPTQAGALNVLPNLDIVALGDIHPADRLHLSTFAHQTNDHVWTVSADSLLAAVDSGREIAELASFLGRHCARELPNALLTLISDVQRRAAVLTDLGLARVVECVDPATAALIAHGRQLRTLCRLIGDRHLVVPADQELKFRKALRKLGYVVPPRHV